MRTSLERYFVLFHYLISLWSCQFDGHLLHFLFPIAKLWQGRWQGNEIVVKVLKVRDWTTRKSRDFNEEYPKLRLLLNLDFSSASVFFSCCGHSFVCLHCVKPDLVYYFFLLHFTQFVCSRQILCGLSLFVCLSVPPSLSPTLPSIPGYFPTQMSYLCWEHVSLLLPLTPSSSHTGCLMAPSTTFCMKAPVSTSTLVTKSVLVTRSGGLRGFVINCTYCTFVMMLPSLYCM